MEDKYGPSSHFLQKYDRKLEDRKRFTRYVLDGADVLDSLYNSFYPEMSYEEKLKQKRTAIRNFVDGLSTLPFHDEYYTDYFKDFTPDNTFFMSYLRYRGGQEIFEETLREKFDGNLRKYIEALKSEYGR